MTRSLIPNADVLLGTTARGRLLTLREPLSFWGGVDPATGAIVDRNHPQRGTSLARRALLTGATRGSSSSSSTLLECVRRETAPSLLLLTARDPILVVGAAAAWEIYGSGPAVIFVDPDELSWTAGSDPDVGDLVDVELLADGNLCVSTAGHDEEGA